MADDKLVLVTGASGYIACHVVQQLQLAGYRVRGTVRSLANEQRVAPLRQLAPGAKHPLDLVEANLDSDQGWDKAVEGCWAVLHTASPFPNVAVGPASEESVVKPAVEGTTRVLTAAADAGVKMVVLTSSFAAVHAETYTTKDKVYSEDDWTDPTDPTVENYSRSKTKAERAAWELLDKLPQEKKFEMSVINPTFVMGPPLMESHKTSTSIQFVTDFLTHKNPGVPKIMLYFCDVRDVAKAHVEALTNPAAIGKRHIILSDTHWLKEIAGMLSAEFKPQGYKVPTTVIPDCVVWAASLFMSQMKTIKPLIGLEVKINNDRLTKVLGIKPIPMRQSLADTGYAIIDFGIVPKTPKYRQTGPQTSEKK